VDVALSASDAGDAAVRVMNLDRPDERNPDRALPHLRVSGRVARPGWSARAHGLDEVVGVAAAALRPELAAMPGVADLVRGLLVEWATAVARSDNVMQGVLGETHGRCQCPRPARLDAAARVAQGWRAWDVLRRALPAGDERIRMPDVIYAMGGARRSGAAVGDLKDASVVEMPDGATRC